MGEAVDAVRKGVRTQRRFSIQVICPCHILLPQWSLLRCFFCSSIWVRRRKTAAYDSRFRWDRLLRDRLLWLESVRYLSLYKMLWTLHYCTRYRIVCSLVCHVGDTECASVLKSRYPLICLRCNLLQTRKCICQLSGRRSFHRAEWRQCWCKLGPRWNGGV